MKNDRHVWEWLPVWDKNWETFWELRLRSNSFTAIITPFHSAIRYTSKPFCYEILFNDKFSWMSLLKNIFQGYVLFTMSRKRKTDIVGKVIYVSIANQHISDVSGSSFMQSKSSYLQNQDLNWDFFWIQSLNLRLTHA